MLNIPVQSCLCLVTLATQKVQEWTSGAENCGLVVFKTYVGSICPDDCRLDGRQQPYASLYGRLVFLSVWVLFFSGDVFSTSSFWEEGSQQTS